MSFNTKLNCRFVSYFEGIVDVVLQQVSWTTHSTLCGCEVYTVWAAATSAGSVRPMERCESAKRVLRNSERQRRVWDLCHEVCVMKLYFGGYLVGSA